jgi:hypothetical protein
MENKLKEEPESKEENWEKRFDLLYTFRFEDGKENADMIGKAIKVKQFIRSEKKKSRKELLTELEEKLPKERNIDPTKSIYTVGKVDGYNDCLKQILSIINLIK